MNRTKKCAVAVVLVAAVSAAGLTACSSGNGDGSSGGAATGGATASGAAGSSAALSAALQKGGSLTYWSWTPEAKAQVAEFQKEYPNVTVTYVNAGSGTDQYTKISNAIKAGSGAPDVAQFEYTALPQFAYGGDLVDLTPYGLGQDKSLFTDGAWGNVALGHGLYALPQDQGPMALFYNKKVFDKYGLTVPTTWSQFVDDAKKLHAADPSSYLTSDGGDGLFASSLIWQAGGHPYQVDGTSVTINLQDPGAKKWTSVWNQLVEGQLLSPTPSWTDDWYKQLGNGQIAALVSGAWMPGLLASSAPDGKGDWQAAPMPTYDGGPAVSANYGGSATAVVKGSKNPELAAAFVQWLSESDASLKIFMDDAGFPTTVKQLKDPSFADATNAYFGGQKVNQVLLAAANTVAPGWSWLPYQEYAQTIFADSVGQAYANHTDLNAGLVAWQKALVDYGKAQGFQVTSGQ